MVYKQSFCTTLSLDYYGSCNLITNKVHLQGTSLMWYYITWYFLHTCSLFLVYHDSTIERWRVVLFMHIHCLAVMYNVLKPELPCPQPNPTHHYMVSLTISYALNLLFWKVICICMHMFGVREKEFYLHFPRVSKKATKRDGNRVWKRSLSCISLSKRWKRRRTQAGSAHPPGVSKCLWI